MALEGYSRNVYGNRARGDLSIVCIQATFTSGAATRDAATSSPGTTISSGSGSVYDITFPACTFVHVLGLALDNKDTTPDGADAVLPIAINIAAAGTGKIAIMASDDGLVVDPDDNARLYVTLLCGAA